MYGKLSAPRYKGALRWTAGELAVRGLPAPITQAEVALAIDNDELKIERGTAHVGAGTISVRGNAPLRGLEVGAARVTITARDLALAGSDGIKATANADLVATWQPSPKEAPAALPELTGAVELRSFEYSRPVVMTADLASLAQRGRRTEIETYDPTADRVRFDVSVRAERPLRIRNNLVEADLDLDRGLQLTGTDQRFGLRGTLRLKPGGRIRLRRNEFEVRQGFVRFDDVTRISPQVDVTAVTEYRRYGETLGGTETQPGAPAASAASATSAAGGNWRITMRAHGDADKLKVDLTSEPALAQDDIFLLLTVGLTRAELDQARSASVGESVALEALGTLTGADRAVAQALPVIDDFRFGSAYSSRTGRTEPTITIGKRLAERIRANVTSGLAESREIRSNVQWRLSPRVSVEGSYDNVNDISSSSLGNLGADVRWRLEFE
jgi:translocation and assembly module TamB